MQLKKDQLQFKSLTILRHVVRSNAVMYQSQTMKEKNVKYIDNSDSETFSTNRLGSLTTNT